MQGEIDIQYKEPYCRYMNPLYFRTKSFRRNLTGIPRKQKVTWPLAGVHRRSKDAVSTAHQYASSGNAIHKKQIYRSGLRRIRLHWGDRVDRIVWRAQSQRQSPRQSIPLYLGHRSSPHMSSCTIRQNPVKRKVDERCITLCVFGTSSSSRSTFCVVGFALPGRARNWDSAMRMNSMEYVKTQAI
jgi:hypothetical protein